MEKKETSIFYLGIAQGECFRRNREERRFGLPIRILKKRLEYPGGYLKIFYAMLPEFCGRRFGTKKGKTWNPKQKQLMVQRTLERVCREAAHCEMVLDAQLAFEQQEIPLELKAAYLHNYVPFESVCVCFSGEGGTFEAREAILLLSPYLKRMRQVILCGETCAATELFSEYLYYEYGIVPERKLTIGQFGVQRFEMPIVLVFGNQKIDEMASVRASHVIDNEETWKFLDTTIKNGYNTES